MTKEELEKEAEVFVSEKADKGNFDVEKFGKAYFSESSMKQALVKFAEPREKQIADLEDKLANADYQLEGRDLEIKELEAQIEKMKVKWHDLEKDPNDLPKDCKTMCICLGDFGSKYQPVPQVYVGYYDSLGWSDYMGSSLYSTVRYWCELPQF